MKKDVEIQVADFIFFHFLCIESTWKLPGSQARVGAEGRSGQAMQAAGVCNGETQSSLTTQPQLQTDATYLFVAPFHRRRQSVFPIHFMHSTSSHHSLIDKVTPPGFTG